MISRPPARHNGEMPELPDLDILADAFHAALSGRRVTGADVPQPLVLRGTAAEVAALAEQRLMHVRRRGKFLVFELEQDRITVNPMLTGRLGVAATDARVPASTAFLLRLGPRVSAVSDPAIWTSGAAWLPADGSAIDLCYRDTTRMGKVYLQPPGVTRRVAGWDEQGPDADDPALDLTTWRTRMARHSGELKNLLKNQTFVAGIGNGYADEILWAARLAPFRTRATLALEEVDRLHDATRTVLAWAVRELRQLVPPRFEVEQRAFLRVHRKGSQPCPRCGATITEVAPGGFVTSWCRACQA